MTKASSIVYLGSHENDVESCFSFVRPLVFCLLLKKLIRGIFVQRLCTGCITKPSVLFSSGWVCSNAEALGKTAAAVGWM